MYKSSSPQNVEATPEAAITNPLDVIRVLRPVSGVLFSRMALYAELLGVEWAEQKIRLSKMFAYILLGFSSMLCVMLFAGILVTVLCWDSAYRIQAIVAVMAVYGTGVGIAWYRLNSLSTLSDHAFSATREELMADIALIKSKL